MGEIVSVSEAAERTGLSESHIRWLLREKKVAGVKSKHIWLVDLQSLQAYQAQIEQLGTKKHNRYRNHD